LFYVGVQVEQFRGKVKQKKHSVLPGKADNRSEPLLGQTGKKNLMKIDMRNA
jgi:hypothetical protein